MALGWFYSPSQIGRYIISRVTSLAPPKVGLLMYGLLAMDIVLMTPVRRTNCETRLPSCGTSLCINGSCSRWASCAGPGMLSISSRCP